MKKNSNPQAISINPDEESDDDSYSNYDDDVMDALTGDEE